MRLKFFFIGLIILISCAKQTQAPQSIHQVQNKNQKEKPRNNITSIKLGLDVLLDEKIELIKNKNIGLVTNNSGIDSKGISNFERLMKTKKILQIFLKILNMLTWKTKQEKLKKLNTMRRLI